jgi:hypothetical protein
MPLNVDYSPVGAIGSLSAAAGYGRGQEVANQQMIQLQHNLAQQGLARQEMALRQRLAQQQAFQLQQAMAERMAMARMRTPAASHVLDRLKMQDEIRKTRQTEERSQLDAMLQSGTITQPQYEQAMMGVLSGSPLVISKAFTKDKPAISKSVVLSTRLRPLRDRRAMLQKQLAEYNKNTLGGLTDTNYAATVKQMNDDLEKTFTDEHDLVNSVIDQDATPGLAVPEEAGMAAPAADPLEGKTAVNKQTGQRIKRTGGKWVPIQ